MTPEREQLLDQNFAVPPKPAIFQHQGIWLPAGEKHFPDWMTKNGEIVDGKGTYQIKKFRAAMEHCKRFRVAVDVGAHVGLWSMQIVKRFQIVHAFEPVMEFRQCWTRNVDTKHQIMCDVEAGESPREIVDARMASGLGNAAILYGVALGAARGLVAMAIDDADTGGTHVAMSHGQPVSGGDIEVRTLDEFDLADVDFLKIDCEGYEHHVIAGARETLIRCRPCVIVEQKQHIMGRNFGIKGTPAVDMLRELGAEVRREISGDYVLSWP